MSKSLLAPRFNAHIKRDGWSVVGVMGAPNQPPFAYSVGATETLKAPELLVFGLPAQYGAMAINLLQKQVQDSGIWLADEVKYLGEEFTFPVMIKDITVDAAKQWCLQALYHYEDTPLEPTFQQIVLPDEKGLFPWEGGYDGTSGRMRKVQPELWK